MVGEFWRVYVREWTVAYISDTEGDAGRAECEAKFADAYGGRVRDDEWRVEPFSLTDPGGWPWMLMLRLPVMKGEYPTRPLAQDHATRVDGEVVQEHSTRDQGLIRYGQLMLGKEESTTS